MSCYHRNCSKTPKWHPVLILRSRKNSSPFRMKFLQLLFCDSHRESYTLNDLLSDEGFTKISKFLKENGKTAPSQRCTILDWTPIPIDEIPVLTPRDQPSPSDDDLPF